MLIVSFNSEVIMPKIVLQSALPVMPEISDLINPRDVIVGTLEGQIDDERVLKNLRLFQLISCLGGNLHYFIIKKPTGWKEQVKLLVSDILTTMLEFSTDGGLAFGELKEGLPEIQFYISTLKNYMDIQNRRPLPEYELLRDIPFCMIFTAGKILKYADTFCNKWLKRSLDHSRSISVIINRFPTIEKIRIFRLMELIETKTDSYFIELLDDISRKYYTEYFRLLLPAYIALLESKEFQSEDKVKIVKYIWVLLYENINAGKGLYSIQRDHLAIRNQFVQEGCNTQFSFFRQLFVHAVNHEELNVQLQRLLAEHPEDIIELGIVLLKTVLQHHDLNNFDEKRDFFKLLSDFNKNHMSHFRFKADSKIRFSQIASCDVHNTSYDSRESYVVGTLDKLTSDFLKYFAVNEKENKACLQGSFLKLPAKLQVKYVILIDYLQNFGECYRLILKDKVFDEINQTARRGGNRGVDEIDARFDTIRQLAIDCIVVRNNSVHRDIRNNILEVFYKIKNDGGEVLYMLKSIIDQLKKDPHQIPGLSGSNPIP